MAVEQFIRHIALIIQIADMRGRQSQQHRLRIQLDQPVHPFGPFCRASAVKLIQDDQIRLKRIQLFQAHVHQLGIREKIKICK